MGGGTPDSGCPDAGLNGGACDSIVVINLVVVSDFEIGICAPTVPPSDRGLGEGKCAGMEATGGTVLTLIFHLHDNVVRLF